MRDPELDHAGMAQRRENMMAAAYSLFTERNIESVTMAEIAKRAGCGNRTLHRYFDTKPALVVAVAVWKWRNFSAENFRRRPEKDFAGMTAAEVFAFYLDSFIQLYKSHKDLLRFNQLFNIYIRAEHVDTQVMRPYSALISELEQRFAIITSKAAQDHTIRTDLPEQEVFSTTLHLMLAAVTRYAVGLIYIPENGFDAVKELEVLKEALLLKYRPQET